MKTFQQFIEQEVNPQSPSAGVSQTTQQPQLTQVQNQPMTPPSINDQSRNMGRTEVKKALRLLSQKLGINPAAYKPLVDDIQPKNMQLFFNLIEKLSTLKASAGTNAMRGFQ